MSQEIQASESTGQNGSQESNTTCSTEKTSSENTIQNKKGISNYNLNDYFGLPEIYHY